MKPDTLDLNSFLDDISKSVREHLLAQGVMLRMAQLTPKVELDLPEGPLFAVLIKTLLKEISNSRPGRELCLTADFKSDELLISIGPVDAPATGNLLQLAEATTNGPLSEIASRLGIVFQQDGELLVLRVPAKEIRATLPSIQRTGLKILVAEDNPINAMVIRRLLVSKGHTVQVVGDGKECLTALKGEDFDLHFVDISMPIVDGLTVIKTMRNEESVTGRSHRHVVVLTAHAMPGDKERILQAGADFYMSKPIDSEMLFAYLADQATQGVA